MFPARGAPRMTATNLPASPAELADAARLLREAVATRAYRDTPVGDVVGRYIRWFRNEWGATPATVRNYEAPLARMALTLADRELIEVTTEDLRDVIDLWADRAPRTRARITSIFHSFWGWCEREGRIAISPAARILRPRAERRVARVLPLTARPDLLGVAKEPRDRLGLYCLLVLGIRRSELAGIHVRDFDRERGQVRVLGKGQKERVLPLPGPVVDELRLFLVAELPHVGRLPEADDYLLYPVDRRAGGKDARNRMTWTATGRPKDCPSPQAVHRWWYRLAQQAGLVGKGITSGMNMHRARHTFAMELRRVSNLESASYALGHADLSTTLGIYGHFDPTDLEKAMHAYGAWLEGGEER